MAVGDTRVTPIEYRLAYDRQLAILSRNFGTRLTTEQARALGLENQVLGQVVSNAALDEQSRRMNLGLSQDRLANIIADDPAFRGINGRFDRNVFANLLRNVGMSEEDYIVSQESAAIRSQIVEAIADGYEAPTTIMRAIYEFNNEARTLDYIVLNANAVDAVADPSDEELKSYFRGQQDYLPGTGIPKDCLCQIAGWRHHRSGFDQRRGSTRRLRLAPRTLHHAGTTHDRAAEFHRRRCSKGRCRKNRRRRLVRGGGGGGRPDDVRCQSRKRSKKARSPDPAIADAAFAIAGQGNTSDVVNGSFGPVILRVTEIQPESTRSFDEVSDEIRGELALVEAENRIAGCSRRL